VGSIVFDFEKASDCINHGILLAKLEFHGITDRAYSLINHILKTDIKERM